LHVQRLRGIALFAALSDETLEHIAGAATIRCYASDEHVALEGDPCDAGFFILEGSVRIYRVSADGREQVLVRRGPGQAFNTAPLFQPEGKNPAHAVALTPLTLCVLHKGDFLRLVMAHGDLAAMVLQDFAERLLHLTDLVAGLALQSVQERLARFLLDRASVPQAPPAPPAFPHARKEQNIELRRWTQQEIATHLGTVRDVVGRELRALERAGIVRLERGRIVLLDREALEVLAER
jgi:CRP/FNR family transcriptional regulator, cyclic AMP receptor protein